MKIIKYSKLKDNRYNIKFDDREDIKLYDDIIIKYDLIRNKELDDNKLEDIIKDNNELEVYYKAIKFITTKLRTEKEIYNKFIKDYDSKLVNKTIKKLKEEKYLNNDIYLRCYIDDQVLLNNIGPNKIKDNLLKLGLYEEDINNYLENIDKEVWLNKLEKIINKKINSNHSYSNNKLKEKLVYDLSNQGFYKYMIEEVIDRSNFKEDNNLLERDFDKLYNKLCKKYEGKELDYQLRNRLLQKGYYYEDINNIMDNKKGL